MDATPIPHADASDAWIKVIFSAKQVQRGGVVRRASAWVEAEIGRDRMIREVRRRGFHMVESGGQLIVICSPGGIRVVC